MTPVLHRPLSRAIPCVLASVLCVLYAAPSASQLSLPIEATGDIQTVAEHLIFTIDLATLPNRPEIHIVATPDAADVELEIELTNWTGLGNGGQCPSGQVYDGGPTFTSSPSIGTATLANALWLCNPVTNTGFWASGTVDVIVRAADFGATGPPVDVDVSIRGVTQVPTAEHFIAVETDIDPQIVDLAPSRDTVLYASDVTASNGAGAYLWAGHDFQLIGGPFIFARVWYRLNSLLAFNVVGNLPPNAIVSSASLRLYSVEARSGGGTISLYEGAPEASGWTWSQGNADAAGDEFEGTTSSFVAANWNYRRSTQQPWTVPGGDVTGPPLDSMLVNSTGYKTFSGAAVESAVQAMVDDQWDDDGFLLEGPGGGTIGIDYAVRFASGNHPTSGLRPRLQVHYTPAGPYSSGEFETGTVAFIGEGDDFRWIYDTDQDDVLETPPGGICVALSQSEGYLLPYTYSFEGDPQFQGTDCCSWRINSPQTETVGVGQAIFFHDLDPNDSANWPGDSDGDGMRDGCDNCPSVPNGPNLGSCIGLMGIGGTCQANEDCGQFEFCSLSQEDADLDETGDACSVPEPTTGVSMLLGIGWLAGLRRRATRLDRVVLQRASQRTR